MKFKGRRDSHKSRLPLLKAVCFPTVSSLSEDVIRLSVFLIFLFSFSVRLQPLPH